MITQSGIERFKTPPKGLLDPIAESAIASKIKIIPVGGNKHPCIKNWQQTGSGSFDRQKLIKWRVTHKNPRWGIPSGPENGLFFLDADFEKDQDKKPIGPPILGIIKMEWLKQSSFKQQTQTEFNGQKGIHFAFPWEDRFNIFTNKKIPTTTLDIRTRRGQVVAYRPIPPRKILDNMATMPEGLFQALIKLLKVKDGTGDFTPGNRNNTLFAKAARDLETNQGRNIPNIIEKAQEAGLDKKEINTTVKSSLKTVVKGDHGFDPGPNGARASKTHKSAKATPGEQKKQAIASNKVLKPEAVSLITPLNFPTGSITIFGGVPGY